MQQSITIPLSLSLSKKKKKKNHPNSSMKNGKSRRPVAHWQWGCQLNSAGNRQNSGSILKLKPRYHSLLVTETTIHRKYGPRNPITWTSSYLGNYDFLCTLRLPFKSPSLLQRPHPPQKKKKSPSLLQYSLLLATFLKFMSY